MKIVICDDEQYWIDKIKTILEEHYNHHNIDIIEFNKSIDLLNYLSVEICDILILDIEMPKLSGIQIKNKISAFSSCKIIFVTNHENHWKNAFGINVVGFVEKENLGELNSYLTAIENTLKNNFILEIGNDKIDSSLILYIQADGAYIHIITNTNDYYHCISISNILQRLNPNLFIRIHRSYIVNMQYIEEYHAKYIKLVDNLEMKISRTYRLVVREQYLNYLHEKNKGECL